MRTPRCGGPPRLQRPSSPRLAWGCGLFKRCHPWHSAQHRAPGFLRGEKAVEGLSLISHGTEDRAVSAKQDWGSRLKALVCLLRCPGGSKTSGNCPGSGARWRRTRSRPVPTSLGTLQRSARLIDWSPTTHYLPVHPEASTSPGNGRTANAAAGRWTSRAQHRNARGHALRGRGRHRTSRTSLRVVLSPWDRNYSSWTARLTARRSRGRRRCTGWASSSSFSSRTALRLSISTSNEKAMAE